MIQLRPKHWFLLFTSVILIIAILLATCVLKSNMAAKSSVSISSESKTIIVDAGHGGFDGGAIGVNGTIEKDVNLSIALKLRDMLESAGYTVIMTRETDTALNDENDVSTKSKKVSDMRNRLNLTKLYPNSILVSIHQNLLEGDSSVHGGQIFYSPNDESSQALAQIIQDEFNSYINGEKARQIVETGKNLYLFYNAQNTAVLCECGFLSNPEEEQLLTTDEYQCKIAYCIFSGILLYSES